MQSKMSTFLEILAAKEAVMQEHGVSLDHVLSEANIHRTTWERWKRDKVGPRLKTWLRVEQVINEAISRGTAA